MDLLKDPQAVEILAKKLDDETFSFLQSLKSFSSQKIDLEVWKLNEWVSSQIDCTQCGNCCKRMNAACDDKEAERLASALSMTKKEFTDSHCEQNEIEQIFFIKKLPCVFLKNKKCSVYADRPGSCAEYPHLNKPNFKFRSKSVLANYHHCPIVFNVVEALKLKFKN
jgi:Fe-S-cluster containining protein